jgi:hypothetical protein
MMSYYTTRLWSEYIAWPLTRDFLINICKWRKNVFTGITLNLPTCEDTSFAIQQISLPPLQLYSPTLKLESWNIIFIEGHKSHKNVRIGTFRSKVNHYELQLSQKVWPNSGNFVLLMQLWKIVITTVNNERALQKSSRCINKTSTNSSHLQTMSIYSWFIFLTLPHFWIKFISGLEHIQYVFIFLNLPWSQILLAGWT